MNFFASDFFFLQIMWFLIENVSSERLCCWEMCCHLNNITLYITSYLVSKQRSSHYFVILCFALWTKKVLKLASVQCFSASNLLFHLWLCLCHHSFWCFMNFPFRNHFWYSYDLWSFNLMYLFTWNYDIPDLQPQEYLIFIPFFKSFDPNFWDENELMRTNFELLSLVILECFWYLYDLLICNLKWFLCLCWSCFLLNDFVHEIDTRFHMLRPILFFNFVAPMRCFLSFWSHS